MILSIFLLVIGIALALIVTGVILEDYAVQLVGFSFLFISGTLLLAGSVEYKTGEDITTTHQYILNNTLLNSTQQSNVYQYADFNDSTSRWFGIYLMVVSILGSAVIFTRLKQEKDNEP